MDTNKFVLHSDEKRYIILSLEPTFLAGLAAESSSYRDRS